MPRATLPQPKFSLPKATFPGLATIVSFAAEFAYGSREGGRDPSVWIPDADVRVFWISVEPSPEYAAGERDLGVLAVRSGDTLGVELPVELLMRTFDCRWGIPQSLIELHAALTLELARPGIDPKTKADIEASLVLCDQHQERFGAAFDRPGRYRLKVGIPAGRSSPLRFSVHPNNFVGHQLGSTGSARLPQRLKISFGGLAKRSA